jgi:DNA-directed RNA polymerase specialized sigma24 family protein
VARDQFQSIYLDGWSLFSPEHTVHNETRIWETFARTFTSEDIDSVKRNLGQVKDLARPASSFQKELLALHGQGLSMCEIARRLGLHRKSVARAIRRAKPRV